MSDPLQSLASALAGRYAIERELGAGGMALRVVGRYGGRAVGGRRV